MKLKINHYLMKKNFLIERCSEKISEIVLEI